MSTFKFSALLLLSVLSLEHKSQTAGCVSFNFGPQYKTLWSELDVE